MRVFGISDLHVDYAPNRAFIEDLSRADYRDDLLIVAGDLTHDDRLLLATLATLQERFRSVWFVPGNHDLWVDAEGEDSFAKWLRLEAELDTLGIHTRTGSAGGVRIVPLLTWYDFSFGEPDELLQRAWRDFVRCRWPEAWSMAEVSAAFLGRNPLPTPRQPEEFVITVSHFLPRADLLPRVAVERYGFLLPVLGGDGVERALRPHEPQLHLYGHSHVPVDKVRDGLRYVNNAKGYPSEYRYADRQLKQLY